MCVCVCVCVCVLAQGGVVVGVGTHLILLKTLSRSFFISTRVRVWSRKRSFICCSLTFDSPLKLMSISLVFSKRSSLFSQQISRATELPSGVFIQRETAVQLLHHKAGSKSKICTNVKRSEEGYKDQSGPDTHMCLWAWMMALTSSELTMLSILLQNTPEAVGSAMMRVETTKLQTQTFI